MFFTIIPCYILAKVSKIKALLRQKKVLFFKTIASLYKKWHGLDHLQISPNLINCPDVALRSGLFSQYTRHGCYLVFISTRTWNILPGKQNSLHRFGLVFINHLGLLLYFPLFIQMFWNCVDKACGIVYKM